MDSKQSVALYWVGPWVLVWYLTSVLQTKFNTPVKRLLVYHARHLVPTSPGWNGECLAGGRPSEIKLIEWRQTHAPPPTNQLLLCVVGHLSTKLFSNIFRSLLILLPWAFISLIKWLSICPRNKLLNGSWYLALLLRCELFARAGLCSVILGAKLYELLTTVQATKVKSTWARYLEMLLQGFQPCDKIIQTEVYIANGC